MVYQWLASLYAPLTEMLLGVMSDAFNRSLNALEKAGVIDRREMNKQYGGVGSQFYDLVTEQMEYTVKHAVSAMRLLVHRGTPPSESDTGSSSGTSSMKPQRQEAYRHLLYTSLLHLRSGHRDIVWWNPASWWRTASELRLCRDLANSFHNLAFFTVWNFEGFDEGRFWLDIERMGQTHGSKLVERYRRIFDEYVAGRTALIW